MPPYIASKKVLFVFLSMTLVGLQGCVATRDWVTEHISPLAARLSGTEGRLDKIEGRLGNVEGQLNKIGGEVSATHSRLGIIGGQVAGLEGRLGQTDTKANKALESLANLRLERRFVLDLKEGATFAFSSAVLTDPTKREIDGFLNDLKGEGDGMLFLVTGHTDSRGREDLNYELGRKRAESVSRYLIAQRKIDPTRVLTVSYGPSAPLAENNTREGRSKNRRIEILVFKEGISTAATTPEKMAERAERRK